MKKFLCAVFLFLCGMFAGLAALLYLPEPWDAWIGYSLAVFTVCFLCYPKKKRKNKIKIGPFAWTVNDFCRGWLITGQTGSGKTACAIKTILHALFKDCPDWGGVVVDQKGQFYEIVAGIAKHYKCEEKLVILRVGDNPQAKYNLLSYEDISWQKYATIIIDTAEAIGLKLEPFWKSNAETLIAGILQMIAVIRTPTFADIIFYIYEINELKNLVNNTIKKNSSFASYSAATKVKAFLDLVPETRDGVLSSTKTVVECFSDPKIQEVFCPQENTVDFREIDQGKIFIISMAQSFSTERSFFNTFLKLLFTTHAKARFDTPETLCKKNLIAFIADEAQLVVTSAKRAADHEAVSIIREAKATYILATQSITSFGSVLKKEDVQSLVLNLASKIYFTVADQNAAEIASKDLGIQRTLEKSKSVTKGTESISTREIEKPIYSSGELRALKKYECVIKHPSGKTDQLYLPPRDDAGDIPSYYYKDRFGVFWFFFYLLQI